jgi:hypothetical protein
MDRSLIDKRLDAFVDEIRDKEFAIGMEAEMDNEIDQNNPDGSGGSEFERLIHKIEEETEFRFGRSPNEPESLQHDLEWVTERAQFYSDTEQALLDYAKGQTGKSEFYDKINLILQEIKSSLGISKKDKFELRKNARDALEAAVTVIEKHNATIDAELTQLRIFPHSPIRKAR